MKSKASSVHCMKLKKPSDLAVAKAQETGERIVVLKSPREIQDEMGQTEGHLAALSGVSEEIERQYESYSKLFLELREKAELVAENREKTLGRSQNTVAIMATVMENLMSRVNGEYQRIMSQTLATGEVQLSNPQDIETAGLDIYVGFKGSKPVALGCLHAEWWRTYHSHHGVPSCTCSSMFVRPSAQLTNTTSTWTPETAK